MPKPGPSLRKVFSQDSESQTSESSSHSDSDYRTPDESSTTKKKKKKKKKNKKLNTSKAIEVPGYLLNESKFSFCFFVDLLAGFLQLI